MSTEDERRAPLQDEFSSWRGLRKLTIAWAEHEECFAAYAAKYRTTQQTAEDIAKRGGFGLGEFRMLLGRSPRTLEVCGS